jgi:protein SCO1/2
MSSETRVATVPAWARAVATVALLGAFLAILVLGLRSRTLPVLGAIPAFTLTDQRGASFAPSALAGKVWVANFIFTHCRETCPRMTAQMLRLQDQLAADPALAAGVRLVSFTVDPERDKPPVLEAYGKSYGADGAVWTFLTGDAAVIGKLCQESFRLPLGGGSGAHDAAAPPALIHSDRFVLVDGTGQVRGYYSPIGADADTELRRLLGDVRTLLE